MNDAAKPLSLTVADALRARILRGDFAPDERLQEVVVAESMQVSRTPVREALRILAEDGLLVYSPNRGYSIKRFSTEDILVAFRARAAMEGVGARLLAERGLDAVTLQKLAAILADGDALLARGRLPEEGIEAWREMNRRYHVTLLLAAQSDLLVRVARDAQNIPVVNAGAFQWYGLAQFQRQHALHHMIVDAIRERQPERAEALMREHVLEAGEIVRRNLQK